VTLGVESSSDCTYSVKVSSSDQEVISLDPASARIVTVEDSHSLILDTNSIRSKMAFYVVLTRSDGSMTSKSVVITILQNSIPSNLGFEGEISTEFNLSRSEELTYEFPKLSSSDQITLQVEFTDNARYGVSLLFDSSTGIITLDIAAANMSVGAHEVKFTILQNNEFYIFNTYKLSINVINVNEAIGNDENTQ